MSLLNKQTTEDDTLPLQLGKTKGFSRLLQILDSNIKHLFFTSLLVLLAHIPTLLLCIYAIWIGNSILFVVSAVLTGPLCTLAHCTMYDVVLRALRDEAAPWWSSFCKALHQNLRISVIPGFLFGAAFGVYFTAFFTIINTGNLPPVSTIVLMVVSIFFLTSVYTLTIAQSVLITLPFFQMISNSLLLLIPYFPRILLSSVLQCVFWIILVLFLPHSATLFILFGFWAAALLALFPIYEKPLNTVFQIEDRLTAMFDNR